MPHDQGILVIGAGELGLSIIASIIQLNKSKEVTVLLRQATLESSEESKVSLRSTLYSLGARIVVGDVVEQGEEELAALFRPFHTVICCTGFSSSVSSGLQSNITKAVLKAGVPRYFPWQFGVDYDILGRTTQGLFDDQVAVRELLRSQNATSWTIISVGVFTSFLFEPFWGVVDFPIHAVRALGSWDDLITATTAEDIGKLTAHILHAESPLQNQVVYVAGDTLTYAELADAIDRVSGRPVKRELWSVEFLKAELEKSPGDDLLRYRLVFGSGAGVAWPMEQTYNYKKGIETVSVESFYAHLQHTKNL